MYNYCLKRSVDLYLVFRQALEIGDARPCVTRNIFRSHLIVPTIDRLVFSLCFSVRFLFFFFLFSLRDRASPFEAVERGPLRRCCGVDLVPTFALRGRRRVVLAGARVVPTS